jgi:hypothetical protein
MFHDPTRNGRATDPRVALLLLFRQTMRSALCAVVIIAGVVMFTRQDSGTVSAAPAHAVDAGVLDARDTRKDVYGNEIAPAVADYLIDPYGEMYESHAPDTALPKLGQPES